MSALEDDIASLKSEIATLKTQITSKQESLSNYVRSKFPATEEDLFRNDSYFQRLDNQLTSLNNQLLEKEKQHTILLQQTQQDAMSDKPKMIKLPSEEALEKFEQMVDQKLENNLLRVLVKDFPEYWEAIKLNRIDKSHCIFVMKLLQTFVKSKTKIKVMQESGIIFGRTIGTGKGTTLILNAFSQLSKKHYAAKLFVDYGVDVESTASFELMTSRMLQPHENIIAIEDLHRFEHCDGTKGIALLMPRFLMSLEIVVKEIERGGRLQRDFFLDICRGLLSAGAQFQHHNIAHCDIKPANIMINNGKPVLIDFGAVTSIGCNISEGTDIYALDADLNIATLYYDLCCIVTTVAACFIPKFELQKRTRSEMKKLIVEASQNNPGLEFYATVCVTILEAQSCKDALLAFEKLLEV